MSYFSDNFTLINKIGSGSFGEVYIAQNIKGKKFATKVEEKSSNSRLLAE